MKYLILGLQISTSVNYLSGHKEAQFTTNPSYQHACEPPGTPGEQQCVLLFQ